MKYSVKKDGNEITLTVTLSKKEMQADENIAFGHRSARKYLSDKGHDLERMISHQPAANKGGNASKEGKFVFEVKQKAPAKKKVTPKNTVPSPVVKKTTPGEKSVK